MTMFGGCSRQSQSPASSATTSLSIETSVSLIKGTEEKLSKNSRQQQNQINMQEAHIKSLQNQNEQLQGLLDPNSLVNVISQAVTTSLKMGSQLTVKGEVENKGAGFNSKPYLGKPRPLQLAPGADVILESIIGVPLLQRQWPPKDKYIKLNHQLAYQQKTTTIEKLANQRLLCPRTRAREDPIVVLRMKILWSVL